MADASFLQTSFLGGEWSPAAQGRMESPTYRSGLNVMRNTLPVEEGSAVRRPGVRMTVATRKGALGVLRAFDFAQSAPYLLELTDGHLRLHNGPSLVLESFGQIIVSSVSAANPAVIGTNSAHGWATGDAVQFVEDPNDTPNYTLSPLFGRELEITVLSSTTFSIIDQLTRAPIDGSTITLGSSNVIVGRVADFATPYLNGSWVNTNTVQNETALVLLNHAYRPRVVTNTISTDGSNFAVFSIGASDFLDGPYLDPPTDGTTITASALTGSVTLTLTGGATRFVATDVGRLVRLFSEPAAWAVGTPYTAGQQVAFAGEYYQAIKANTGKQPDADVINWGVATGAALWTWAQITAWTDATHVTATIRGADILRTTACATWRLGLYSDTTGWPSCGGFHDGRFWLSGVVGNRIDSTMSNQDFTFSPTQPDGTVADNNGCSYIFKATDVNTVFWIEPDDKGLLCGTQAGEWLVSATNQDDILTPTSVQARRKTKIGCANIPPKRTSGSIVFVQKHARKLIEYITTDFRGMTGRNISATGKHLTPLFIKELAYVKELAPIVWARVGDGGLIGCTYKRESPYASDPPDFEGWHRHDLGSGFQVKSIQAGPSTDGTVDALSMLVQDPVTGFCYVHLMTDIFDQDNVIGDSYFVDSGQSPSMLKIDTTTNPHVVRLYSLWRLVGRTISVFIGGVDAGDFVVQADGTVSVPIDNGGLLTTALLAGLTTASNFNGLGVGLQAIAAGVANVPTVTGIQNFDLSPMTHRNGGPTIDFDGGRLFIGNAFDGQYAVYSNTSFKLIAGPFTTPNSNNGLVYAEDGYLYGWIGATNVAILKRMDPMSGAELASFGVASSSMPTDTNHWAYPRDVDTLKIGHTTYLVSSALNASQTSGQISVLNLGSTSLQAIAWTGQTHHTDEFLGVVCKGRPIFGLGCAWVVAHNNALGGSNVVGLYRVLISAGVSSMGKIGFVLPSAIGTGWTHITTCQGIILDETDGNILAHFSTQGLAAWSSISGYFVGDMVSNAGHDFVSIQAGTNHSPTLGGDTFWTDLGVSGPSADTRVVKINVHSLAVMWSNPITSSVPSSQILNQSRIRYGRYNWLDTVSPNSKLHSMNTLTGVDTVGSLLGALIEGGSQFTDDFTGNVYADMQFSFIASPAQIGTTPSSFNSWGTLGPAAGPAVPAALPPQAAVIYTIPVAIGYTYTSQGQILRPIAPAESGARNGPALGKTRRAHMFTSLLLSTQGISFGTTFTKLHAAALVSPGGTPLAKNVLFTGTLQDTLEDDYSFDSMICWQITRPYPASVLTIGSFLHTQDR